MKLLWRRWIRGLHAQVGAAAGATTPSSTSYAAILADLKAHVPANVQYKSQYNTKMLTQLLAPSPFSPSPPSSPSSSSPTPFARDISHLLSLLDALLASGNYTRAANTLKAILPLLPLPDALVFSLNKFLEAWLNDPAVSISDLESFVHNLDHQYPGVKPNNRTLAILLRKRILTNAPYREILGSYLPRHTRQILSHVDVLGVDALAQVLALETITEQHVPPDLLRMFRQVRARPATTLDESSRPVPSIHKDSSDLISVDTFGLKVIRHTLLGLKQELSSLDLDALLSSLLSSPLDQHILFADALNKGDFFKAYQGLTTPEHRAKFNEALDQYNEHRQKQLEMRGADGAREKWKHAFDEMQRRSVVPVNRSLNAQMYQWYEALLPLVQREVDACRAVMELRAAPQPHADRILYAPYLVLVPPEKMCVIAILEIMKLHSSGGIVDGMRTARALLSVGRAIELEYKAEEILAAELRAFSRKSRSQAEWRRLVVRSKKSSVGDDTLNGDWTHTVQAKVGLVLVSGLVRVAKVTVQASDPTTGVAVQGVQPVFTHTYQFVAGLKIGILKIHKEIIRRMAGGLENNLVQPQLLPMLVPPLPWTDHNDGGFIYTRMSILRVKDSAETLAYVKAASSVGNMTEVCAGLNVLGSTAWTVNRQVFDVVSHYWNTGRAFLDIPPVGLAATMPPPIPPNADPHLKFERLRQLRCAMNEAAAARSQRCDTNYKLEIARAFLGEKMFFPHNVDFRGRAYPLSPHFNHLGNDMTRLLFLFWEGKPLGPLGLYWLKIHLANVYGVDKAPLPERVKFVDDNLEQIRNSATDPFAADAWWKRAEKPWQALAVCFELHQAFGLPDPTEFRSHIPIQQDGTCNGLQHYAALGGDVEGARQVNLIPEERPQDVYSFVAQRVELKVRQDAASGDAHAQFLHDKITRKVVKQTVMTNVYGVTFIGATLQIEKQLGPYFADKSQLEAHSRYLTHQVFSAVRELFEGAHHIQDWLGESARRISKSISGDATATDKHMSSVIWTTPLGLPCVQPYRYNKTMMVKTSLQDITITDPFNASQVDARKQQAAFPPNFVHSLDASHMLMTAKACGDAGLSFAAVHDLYWTHACDVPVMNLEIRRQFIRLHENNLIEMLKAEFEKRYQRCFQVVSVDHDHELVGQVKRVRRELALSLNRAVTVADEVFLETKRMEMLELGDAEQVRAGQQMQTTISVTAKYDDLGGSNPARNAFKLLVPLRFPQVPQRGEFDVNVVKDSCYFFS